MLTRFLFMSAILTTMCARTAFCQSLKSSLSTPDMAVLIRDLQTDSTASDAGAQILRDAGVSGGLIVVKGCSTTQKYHFSYRSGETVHDALEQLASSTRSYKWGVANGVVNIQSVGTMPEVLNVRIASFYWNTASPEDGVLPRLMTTPEFSQAVRASGLKPAPYTGGPGVACSSDGRTEKCGNQVPPALRHEQNATVLEILNSIALHGHVIWLFEDLRCGSEQTFRIDLLAHH